MKAFFLCFLPCGLVQKAFFVKMHNVIMLSKIVYIECNILDTCSLQGVVEWQIFSMLDCWYLLSSHSTAVDLYAHSSPSLHL